MMLECYDAVIVPEVASLRCNSAYYNVTPIECSSVTPLFLQVADSRGHTLFRKEDASKGRFAFTTEDYELFEVCFLSMITGKSIGQ